MRKKYNFSLDPAIVERMRNAVYWSPGLTLCGLLEKAITKELDELQKTHPEIVKKRLWPLNKGRQPFIG